MQIAIRVIYLFPNSALNVGYSEPGVVHIRPIYLKVVNHGNEHLRLNQLESLVKQNPHRFNPKVPGIPLQHADAGHERSWLVRTPVLP